MPVCLLGCRLGEIEEMGVRHLFPFCKITDEARPLQIFSGFSARVRRFPPAAWRAVLRWRGFSGGDGLFYFSGSRSRKNSERLKIKFQGLEI